jgi:bifunctional UDP-N-acetylglucosamine pyrophosphorylase/glucosamine-1-phosphate N-acetyltransferase
MAVALVILAAGKGTRMKSDLPKVLHPIAHAAMLIHAIDAAQSLRPERTIVVAGHGAAQVEEAARAHDPKIEIVLQSEQLGTGHAVDQARASLQDFDGDVIVLYGDTPFISPRTLENIQAARKTADIVVLGFEARDPARYGRLIVDSSDKLEKIVEYKDASEAERAITLCNSGVVAADRATLFDLLSEVDNTNASGEYYLTDVPALGRAKGLISKVVRCAEAETLGVNSRVELAQAEALYQHAARQALMESGVTMIDPASVYLAYDTQIGQDTILEPNIVFGPKVHIDAGVTIRAFSHLENCRVASGVTMGPYARLRPGADIRQNAHIGNFVEIKKSTIHEGAKVNHLTYIGDATVGARANIGAGTVTCNYDGVMKHHTEIGEGAFIGSSTMLVAPVRVGDEAMTGSGSVITQDVDDGDLAIGRAKQVNKKGLARRLRDMLIKQKSLKG